MSISIAQIVGFSFILVFFICGLFLLILRGATRPVIFMAIARLFSSGVFLFNFIQNYNMPYYGAVLFNPIHLFLPLLTFPLQFAYIFSLMRPESVHRRYWLATFIPPVAFGLLYIVLILAHGRLPAISDYSQVMAFIGEPELWLRLSLLLMFAGELTILSLTGFRMQRQHIANIPSDFSYTEGISLKWVRWTIYMFLLRGSFGIIGITFEGRIIKAITAIILSVEAILTTVWILRQKDLYRQPSKEELVADLEPVESPSEKMRKKWEKDLLVLLEKEEIFKDPDLDREMVCEMLGINRTYLSQVINQDMNTTFYQLINKYRLEKSVEMLENPHYHHLPLKNISKLCGFKNANTFSKMFKQVYGSTPTEWRGGENGE